jgi:hypothetical protein
MIKVYCTVKNADTVGRKEQTKTLFPARIVKTETIRKRLKND